VIALVHGHVIGGGNGIIAACDVVLAENDTVFAFSEVKLGLTPATISPFVIAKCGEAMARDTMLSGRKFTAQEALKFGLVNYVGTMEEINKRLDYYTDNYLAASPEAIRDCKHLIRAVSGHDDPYSTVFEMTSSLIANERVGADAQERMKKFFE
jgi:methylglutaconyl-CoA hydratase